MATFLAGGGFERTPTLAIATLIAVLPPAGFFTPITASPLLAGLIAVPISLLDIAALGFALAALFEEVDTPGGNFVRGTARFTST